MVRGGAEEQLVQSRQKARVGEKGDGSERRPQTVMEVPRVGLDWLRAGVGRRETLPVLGREFAHLW